MIELVHADHLTITYSRLHVNARTPAAGKIDDARK